MISIGGYEADEHTRDHFLLVTLAVILSLVTLVNAAIILYIVAFGAGRLTCPSPGSGGTSGWLVMTPPRAVEGIHLVNIQLGGKGFSTLYKEG